jgi:hypothetical protein
VDASSDTSRMVTGSLGCESSLNSLAVDCRKCVAPACCAAEKIRQQASGEFSVPVRETRDFFEPRTPSRKTPRPFAANSRQFTEMNFRRALTLPNIFVVRCSPARRFSILAVPSRA